MDLAAEVRPSRLDVGARPRATRASGDALGGLDQALSGLAGRWFTAGVQHIFGKSLLRAPRPSRPRCAVPSGSQLATRRSPDRDGLLPSSLRVISFERCATAWQRGPNILVVS